MDGVTRPLPSPFFVVATQNPFEQVEGQRDRFGVVIENTRWSAGGRWSPRPSCGTARPAPSSPSSSPSAALGWAPRPPGSGGPGPARDGRGSHHLRQGSGPRGTDGGQHPLLARRPVASGRRPRRGPVPLRGPPRLLRADRVQPALISHLDRRLPEPPPWPASRRSAPPSGGTGGRARRSGEYATSLPRGGADARLDTWRRGRPGRGRADCRGGGPSTLSLRARVAQLADAMHSKCIVLRDMWVRVPPRAPTAASILRGRIAGRNVR